MESQNKIGQDRNTASHPENQRKQKVHRSIHDQATHIIQSKDTVPSFEARKADPAWIGSANYSGQNYSKESW